MYRSVIALLTLMAVAFAQPAEESDWWNIFKTIPPAEITDAKLREYLSDVIQDQFPAFAGPTEFDPGYKNPCWTNSNGSVQCLPYFYVFGSFQGGMRDLFNLISKHPYIASPKNPSVHFWSEWQRSSESFVDNFSPAAHLIASERERMYQITGEMSQGTFTYYMAHAGRSHRKYTDLFSECWQRCNKLYNQANKDQQKFLDCKAQECYPSAWKEEKSFEDEVHGYGSVPWLMRAVHGESKIKFVVILRNPVDRLHAAFWSHSHYQKKYGANEDGFMEFIDEQIGGFQNCTKMVTERGDRTADESTRQCALMLEAHGQQFADIFFHSDQLIRGLYAVFLEEWLTAFPNPQSWLIISLDEFQQDREGCVRKVFKHLDLYDPEPIHWQAIMQMPIMGESGDNRRNDMTAEAYEKVKSFYRPFNERLAKLTGHEVFRWDS